MGQRATHVPVGQTAQLWTTALLLRSCVAAGTVLKLPVAVSSSVNWGKCFLSLLWGEEQPLYRPCSQVLSKWCDTYSRTPCREEPSPTSVPSQSPRTCANTEGMQVKGMDMASGFPASPMAKARAGRLAYSQTGSHRTLPLEGQERNLS